jgi:hypothetical protein
LGDDTVQENFETSVTETGDDDTGEISCCTIEDSHAESQSSAAVHLDVFWRL